MYFFSFSFPKLFISYILKITDSIDVKRVILMCWSNISDIFSLAQLVHVKAMFLTNYVMQSVSFYLRKTERDSLFCSEAFTFL